jgi:hypothetical protein
MAIAEYPYASVQKESVFAQLNAVVRGESPQFPASFSDASKSFIALWYL